MHTLHRNIENELRRLLGSARCAALEGGRAELEAAAARYALSDAMLSLAEVAAPEDEELVYQLAVGEAVSVAVREGKDYNLPRLISQSASLIHASCL